MAIEQVLQKLCSKGGYVIASSLFAQTTNNWVVDLPPDDLALIKQQVEELATLYIQICHPSIHLNLSTKPH